MYYIYSTYLYEAFHSNKTFNYLTNNLKKLVSINQLDKIIILKIL